MNKDKIEIVGRFNPIPIYAVGGVSTYESEPIGYREDQRLISIQIKINDKSVKFDHVDIYSLAKYYLNHKPKDWPEVTWSCFQPFTCSCGDAGCAGVWDGIYVRLRKHSVEWRAAKEDGYGFLGKTFFSFDREQYEREFDHFLNFLYFAPEQDIGNLRWTNYVDLGYDEGDETSVEDFFKWLNWNTK